jgi:SulP family sulfate permease
VLGDASGAVADLGVLLPLLAALVLGNGLDVSTALVGVGALYILAALVFRVPVPVQPIKAAAAIAIAQHLDVKLLAAAGLCLGVVLLALAATGAAELLARVFTPPVVRGLQLAVGLLLLKSAVHLKGIPGHGDLLVIAAIIAAILVAAVPRRAPAALLVLAGGIAWGVAAHGGLPAAELHLWQPTLSSGSLEPSVLLQALGVLVLPQLPLTFGNAVVALTDLEHAYFGRAARRVTPRTVSLSCGAANVVTGLLGGMPMCHGSGGLTAHYRAGARTWRMGLYIGVPLLAGGLLFGPTALALLGLIPVAVLAGLLAFTGVCHAALVADLRGYRLLVGVLVGLVGAVTANLAYALVAGLLLHGLPSLGLRRRRPVTA